MKKKTNWLLVIVIFAIIAVSVSYFAGLFKPEQIGKIGAAFGQKDAVMEDFQQKQAAYGAQHADVFISYSDKAMGYSLKYPIGYQIAKDGQLGSNASLRIWADSPFSSSEALTIRYSEADFTSKDFNDALAEVNQTNDAVLTYSHSGTLNGRTAYLFTVLQYMTETDEFFYLKNAVYPDCNAPDGKTYSALLTFAVPEALSEDLDLADYVIYSFKC